MFVSFSPFLKWFFQTVKDFQTIFFVIVNQEAQSSTTIELLVARGGFTACFPMPFSAVRYLNGSCHYWDSFFLLSRPVTIWGMPLVFSNHAKDKIKINSYCIPDCYFSASRLPNEENKSYTNCLLINLDNSRTWCRTLNLSLSLKKEANFSSSLENEMHK